jgi:hypothetical protein
MSLTFLWVLSDADSECVFSEYYLVVNRYSEIVFLLAELRALPGYSSLRTYLAVGIPSHELFCGWLSVKVTPNP